MLVLVFIIYDTTAFPSFIPLFMKMSNYLSLNQRIIPKKQITLVTSISATETLFASYRLQFLKFFLQKQQGNTRKSLWREREHKQSTLLLHTALWPLAVTLTSTSIAQCITIRGPTSDRCAVILLEIQCDVKRTINKHFPRNH